MCGGGGSAAAGVEVTVAWSFNFWFLPVLSESTFGAEALSFTRSSLVGGMLFGVRGLLLSLLLNINIHILSRSRSNSSSSPGVARVTVLLFSCTLTVRSAC